MARRTRCEGSAESIGTQETCQIMWRCSDRFASSPFAPGVDAAAETAPRDLTTPVPPQILPRSIATASLLSHIVSDKLCDGLPLHRQEDRFARLGASTAAR